MWNIHTFRNGANYTLLNLPKNIKLDVTFKKSVWKIFLETKIKTNKEEKFEGHASTMVSKDSLQIDIQGKS